MQVDMSKRVAIITGADTTLGRACAHALAELGARLVLITSEVPAPDLVDELRANGAEAIMLASDPGELEGSGAAARLVATAVGRFSRVDVVVHIVVAEPPGGRDSEPRPPSWASADAALVAARQLAAAALPAFAESGYGRLVSIFARPDVVGATGIDPLSFAPVEGGLAALAASIAETDPEGVSANLIVARVPRTRGRAGTSASRRTASAQDVAGLAAFLASPIGGFVTGQVFGLRADVPLEVEGLGRR